MPTGRGLLPRSEANHSTDRPVALIRVFLRYLHLYRNQRPSDNDPPGGPHQLSLMGESLCDSIFAVPQTSHSGGLMAKLAIFLGGFLALTIVIGILATISPT